jgi:hypothetical protein
MNALDVFSLLYAGNDMRDALYSYWEVECHLADCHGNPWSDIDFSILEHRICAMCGTANRTDEYGNLPLDHGRGHCDNSQCASVRKFFGLGGRVPSGCGGTHLAAIRYRWLRTQMTLRDLRSLRAGDLLTCLAAKMLERMSIEKGKAQ